MNINKKIIKGSAITAAAVTIIATTGFHMVNAADVNKLGVNGTQIIQVADNDTTAAPLAASDIDKSAFKDETVYVIADAAGATKKVIVSDWLKNANGSLGLEDISHLQDITNVKGDETFDTTDSVVTWNAQGNDIYYQGTSDAQLPVTVKVTYTLDGVETAPADLVGKSGKLTVRYDYTNLLKNNVDINGKKEDIYTPLLMITGTALSTENYKNVEVTNGKVISEGNNQFVVGVSLPGMSDSLKLEDDKITIPEYFEYSADVTDYEEGTSVSLGMTNIFADMDINGDEIDLGKIQDKIDELVDGVDKLVDGSSDLYDGLKTLQDKTGEFGDGVSKLSNGLNTLQSNVKALVTGANTLNDGAKSLASGASKLKGGLNDAKAGMDKIVGNYSSVENGVQQLSDGVSKASAGFDSLEKNMKQVNATYETLSKTVSNDEELIAALKKVNAAYKDENIAAIIAKLEANTAGQKQIASGLSVAGGQLLGGVQALGKGTDSLGTGLGTLSAGVKALHAGSTQVQTGLGTLYAGSKSLEDGAKKLQGGTDSLVSSSKKLTSGVDQLAAGGNDLLSASGKLTDGVGKLTDGSKELKDGMKKLKEDGVDKIVDTLDGDVQNIVDRFKALVDQSDSYKNYSGLGNGMDGNVKFIIKYEDSSNK